MPPPTTEFERVAIYYRVSTNLQDFDCQKFAIEEWKAKHTYLTTEVYQDHGISGAKWTEDRPGLEKLMSDARALRFDTLVVYKLDRLSRCSADAIAAILELDKLGVKFISVTQPILCDDGRNPFRKTMLAAFAEIAEIERQQIIDRVRAGLAAARSRGVKLGRKSVYTKEDVKKALALRQRGLSLRTIALQMEKSLGTIHNMLREAQTA